MLCRSDREGLEQAIAPSIHPGLAMACCHHKISVCHVVSRLLFLCFDHVLYWGEFGPVGEVLVALRPSFPCAVEPSQQRRPMPFGAGVSYRF